MNQPDQQLIRVIAALCDDVATPLSARVKTLALRGEWRELQSLRVDPSSDTYVDPEVLFKDVLVVDLLRKCDIDVPGVDKVGAAKATFYSCEAGNYRSNRRLERFIPGLLLEEFEDDPMREFIMHWKKEVASVIGCLPLYLTPRFGPGSTFSDKGKLTTIPDKMTGSPSVTAGASFLCQSMLNGTAWDRALSSGSCPRETVVPGNRFTTVPKDASKHRGICIEPSLNVSFQLDVGRILKARLLGYGIDLRDGQDVHRRAARLASVHDDYATIDLSNASDNICRRLVELVLPKAWFELLDSLRSPKTFIDGKWVVLEKFSSMGNGFTFELETLLYSTLCKTIARLEGGDPSFCLAFGDDLIVPTRHSRTVMSALEFFGFEPNRSKTFTSGYFRESCGGDFFKGVPVRGHFIKDLPREPQQWITLANGLRRCAHSSPSIHRRWAYIHRAWRMCLEAIPSDIRKCRGPVELGDVVIHDLPEFWNPRLRPPSHKDGECRLLRAYTPIAKLVDSKHWRPQVWLAAGLYGVDSQGVAPRGSISGYRFSWVPYQGITWVPDHNKRLRAVGDVRAHVLMI